MGSVLTHISSVPLSESQLIPDGRLQPRDKVQGLSCGVDMLNKVKLGGWVEVGVTPWMSRQFGSVRFGSLVFRHKQTDTVLI